MMGEPGPGAIPSRPGGGLVEIALQGNETLILALPKGRILSEDTPFRQSENQGLVAGQHDLQCGKAFAAPGKLPTPLGLVEGVPRPPRGRPRLADIF